MISLGLLLNLNFTRIAHYLMLRERFLILLAKCTSLLLRLFYLQDLSSQSTTQIPSFSWKFLKYHFHFLLIILKFSYHPSINNRQIQLHSVCYSFKTPILNLNPYLLKLLCLIFRFEVDFLQKVTWFTIIITLGENCQQGIIKFEHLLI
jgi:hypothetical protein